jgi:flagellar hook-basal body complex protein FliE
MNIAAINPNIAAIPAISDGGPIDKTSASGSSKLITQTFEDMLNSLNDSQVKSDTLVQQLSQGDDVDLHTVMIAMEENNINFNVALAMRDKLVEAYREIMRMQV